MTIVVEKVGHGLNDSQIQVDLFTAVVFLLDKHTAPAKPADCHLNWGDRVSLKPGSAPEVHCHGDTIFDPGMPTLDYGRKRSAGPITCESQPAGVTCTDSGTGHFFRMSRETLELG